MMFRPPGEDSLAARTPRIKRVCVEDPVGLDQLVVGLLDLGKTLGQGALGDGSGGRGCGAVSSCN